MGGQRPPTLYRTFKGDQMREGWSRHASDYISLQHDALTASIQSYRINESTNFYNTKLYLVAEHKFRFQISKEVR